MTEPSKPPTSLAYKAAICTAALSGASLILTMVTMSAYHVLLPNLSAVLILLPYLMALGGLGALFGLHASDHSHLALVTTTALLAVCTCCVYIPALSSGPGCMNGMVFIFSTIISIAFPVVYVVCRLLYALC